MLQTTAAAKRFEKERDRFKFALIQMICTIFWYSFLPVGKYLLSAIIWLFLAYYVQPLGQLCDTVQIDALQNGSIISW